MEGGWETANAEELPARSRASKRDWESQRIGVVRLLSSDSELEEMTMGTVVAAEDTRLMGRKVSETRQNNNGIGGTTSSTDNHVINIYLSSNIYPPTRPYRQCLPAGCSLLKLSYKTGLTILVYPENETTSCQIN